VRDTLDILKRFKPDPELYVVRVLLQHDILHRI
jgi:hypothetical protein